ncbi:glutathione transport system permease protein GsiC [Peptococcaceae bacterium CEB3]|nr:glutathione transport system permease protein GsiC [Peptococcaceae bacterium CEB3]
MVNFILKRVLQMIPVLIGVTLVVFLIMHLVPGDPAVLMAGEGASPQRIADIRHQLGLDRPLSVQYADYLRNVLHGNLGTSIRSNRPVLKEILVRLPTTAELAVASVLIMVVIGLGSGILSAMRQGSWSDLLLMVLALLGVSVPSFWIGLMLIYYFAVKIQIFPVAGWGTWAHMVLPAITLGAGGAAIVARMSRASMLEVIRQDYVRTARAKGVKESVIIVKHALKNAIIPVITVVGLEFGALLGGTVLTESVFAINGVGRLIVDSISARDFPVVQGAVLFISVMFMVINLVVDILYRYFNRRIELN